MGFDTNPATTLQKPTDAQVVVDGITYNRSSNTVNDIVPGLTLNLMGPTSGSASIQLTRDTSAMKTNLQDLITSFNDVNSFLKTATDPKSEDPDFGKTLVAGNRPQDEILRTPRAIESMRVVLTKRKTTPEERMLACAHSSGFAPVGAAPR